MGISAKWRGRVPVALLTAGSLTVVGLAIGGASGVPELEFLQPGHWVMNTALGKAFHIDGSTKQVNAEVAVPNADQGSLVVQSDTSGHVVGRGKITEFGKSTLRVKGTTAAPTDDEVPVALEVTGGPYLVYRQAGKVVRLGDEKTPPISTGEPVGNPVATSDGTVWLHYTKSNLLCRLSAGTTAPSCPVPVTAGHTGGLSVVADKPVFVDTTSDTMLLVADTGLTKPKSLDTDVPDDAKIGPGNADGLVPVLDPRGRLILIDSAEVVFDRPGAETKVEPLEPGDYTGPLSTGSTVAVLDQRSGTLHTYDSKGSKRHKTPVPPERGSPRLTKGDDGRVYVDGAEGKHVLVVDPEGKVTPVQANGTRLSASRSLLTPPSETTNQTTTPPAVGDQVPTQQGPAQQQPTRRPAPPPPVVPASPPGAPGAPTATAGNGTVSLAWGAAPDNGAPVTAYHLSWNGGGITVGGDVRAYTVPGLANGTAYTFTVVAQNSAGRGPGATASATPFRAPSITISRGEPENYNENCQKPDCARLFIELHGFEPNTDYRLTAYSSGWGEFNGYTTHTDAQGYNSTLRFHFHGVGQEVWVEAGGVRSNVLYWRDM
ncbi:MULTISPECIES: fibronectin type III domain-containing protein [Saccharothrix]|uniref:fibronectin type III domain-containing protein n=1 Tax=Saccharothrix TaxID=2071 RepID=UPI00093EBCC2|nr:fibronectin type III domain-containing protein [Saccharothrix sp. CB00851]